MKIAIIGSNGQFGTDLMKILTKRHEVIGLTHQDIEVSEYCSCLILKEYQPNVVINTAAFHKTDLCEENPLKAFQVNTIGMKNIAEISKEINAKSVLISTDYVFDGSKEKSYIESDVPFPINTYGISKMAAEQFARLNPKYYIIRLASLFGVAGASGKGGNFVETMIKLARKDEPIEVVDDIYMSPTFTKHAAEIFCKIIELALPYGIYHIANQGYCSWYQFAKEIFKITEMTANLKPIKMNQVITKVKRPHFSALKSIKLPKYDIRIPTWQEGLCEYLIEKGHLQKVSLELHKKSELTNCTKSKLE